MSTAHIFEYSKSSRASCHGPPPCKGSPISLGVLRYGAVSFGPYGERVEWRHWGCVTRGILQQLAQAKLERVPGFQNLRPEDQGKIRLAVGLRRIDPADVPETAKAPEAPATQEEAPGPSQMKRKATFEVSPPSSSQPSSSQVIEIEDDDVPAEEESRDELYCMLKTNIVGVQYYEGLVGTGEQVRLVREPHNKFDRNAIQVNNIGGTKVGHIPREIAAKLAPLLDQNKVTVEGVMHEGNVSGHAYHLSMMLNIYGAADKRLQLEPLLIWATPRQRGFPKYNGVGPRPVPGAPGTSAYGASASQAVAGPSYSQAIGGPSYSTGASSRSAYPASQRLVQPAAQTAAQREATRKQQEDFRKQQEAFAKAAELRQILNNLEKVDDEGRRSSLMDQMCSVEDVLKLPVHPSPPGVQSGDLTVNLLKHQSQALQWCIDREYPTLPKTEADKPVQFWQLKKNGQKTYYFNIATKTPQTAPPVLGRGALCADSMGLGKTLTMIALIMATKADVPLDHSRTTLIVVPVSVISNWEKQIEDHVREGALSSCVYYGTGRSMSAAALKKYDVVITTYTTIAGEHAALLGKTEGARPTKKQKKAEGGLFDVAWKRIILDEGHTIRNARTKAAQAVFALKAQRRWVLTGTPIINSPKDLGTILTFLQICRPLDNEDFYKRMVLRPLKDGDPSGAELLRAVMSQCCIRRTKEMQDSEGNHLVPLPPVEMTTVRVTLTDEARELYDAVEELSKERFDNLVEQHGGINSAAVQSNVLAMLTRMRQLALHPGLLPPNYLAKLRATDDDAPATAVQISPADKIRLQAILAQGIEDSEECPICFNILDQPRITSCAHMFCLACITEVIVRDPKCPMDRRPIGMGDLVEPAPEMDLTQAPIPRDEDEEDDDSALRSGSSAKIDQLVHLLKLTPDTEKSLVFSQFTSFLDKIAETLEKEGIPYVRFDGKMSARRRQQTIARFSVPLDGSTPSAAPVPTQDTSSRPSRTRARRTQASAYVDGEAAFGGNENDGDFIPDDGGKDSDFIDDEDDDDVPKKNGKGKARAKAKKTRTNPVVSRTVLDGSPFADVNPRVMLISLKAGALGLNLTVANNVYLMDPWWQEGIESQAIDRCNRIGQTKSVHVYQLIADDTVESKVIDIQEKKKLLIKEAFSGIKSKETQRQKKEARLQDLVAMFGSRRDSATQNGANTQGTLDEWRS